MSSTFCVAIIFANIIPWFHIKLAQIIKDTKVVLFVYFRYHPDKNANDPKAADMFKEVTFSYNILSDPDKRRQYDTAGFEVRY